MANTTKKITKKDYFTAILAIEEVKANSELSAFVEHEIELLNKKSTDKVKTKTQIENEEIKKIILSQLDSETPKSVAEIQECETLKKYSNQKISALLKLLVDTDCLVKRIVENRKSKFIKVK